MQGLSPDKTEERLLGRLVRVNAVWISVATAALGLAAIYLEVWLKTANHPWLVYLPLGVLGGALVSGAVTVLVFEILLREDSMRRTALSVSQAVAQTELQVRGAVVSELAFGNSELGGLANPEQLDRLIVRSVEARYRNPRLANDSYALMQRQLLDVDERWEQMVVRGSISPLSGYSEWFPASVSAEDYFVCHLSWRYRCQLDRDSFRFVGAGDQVSFSQLMNEHAADFVYRYAPTLPEVLRRVGVGLQVDSLSVNQKDIPIVKDVAREEYLGKADFLQGLKGTEVEISYSVRTLTRRDAHLISFEIPRPCFGASYTLHFDTSVVQNVRILDFFTSVEPVQVRVVPSGDEPRTVSVDATGWVFPRSGFGVVWSLR